MRSSGEIIWKPSAYFQVYCPLNFYYWPFDEHTCTLYFSASNFELIWGGDTESTDMLIENHEWKLENVKVEEGNAESEESINIITYEFTIRRRSSIYRAVVTVPAIVVIFLILGTLWIPPQLAQRIFLDGIKILLINMLLINFSQKTHIMAIHTPLIGKNTYKKLKMNQTLNFCFNFSIILQ